MKTPRQPPTIMLKGLLTQAEIDTLEKRNRKFSITVASLDKTVYLRELERFVIELSWKSSKIEGNTYSLLETETPIKQSVEARGITKAEALTILNHKKAFESILADKEDYEEITISNIT